MTTRHGIWIIAAFLAATITGCGGSALPLPEPPKVGPGAGEAAVDKPFVEFQQASITIDRFETPVEAPVTPGSSPSPATIASDIPDVVSIRDDGALVAHRNGRATIRALQGGGSLAVEVLAASGLRVEPSTLRVSTGFAALPAIKSGDTAIPAGAVSWYSNAPEVAMVEDGRIRAGPTKGSAVLTAVYGGDRVQVTIVVGRREQRKK